MRVGSQGERRLYFIVLRKISRAINGIIEEFPAGLELIIV